jgi:DNA-binding protein
MKHSTTMLSDVSKMKYKLDSKVMSKAVRIENVIRRKFNIKSKLKDIECYTSQMLFIFNYHAVIVLVDKYHK